MFFKMLIGLAGGEENLIRTLEYEKQIRCFLPLCCWHIKPGRIFVHRCKQMILQFVILKPILAVCTCFLAIFGVYDEGNFDPNRGYLYVTIIYNVSFTFALYFLVLFYEAIKKILAKYKPLSKFMCIKAVVFFSYWQSIAIAVMVKFEWVIEEKDDWTVSDVATGLQNFLICVEMFPLALAHIRAFGYNSYMDKASISELSELEQNDVSTLKRVIQVANIGDVFRDTWEALKIGPRRQVEVGTFLEMCREDQRKLVVKEGWLRKRGEDIAKIWKLRYCVLISKPRGLVYFKKNIFEEPLGKPIRARAFIDFTDLVGVSPHMKSLERFSVVTNPRKWHFWARTCKEREEWMLAIEEMHGEIIIGGSAAPVSITLEENQCTPEAPSGVTSVEMEECTI